MAVTPASYDFLFSKAARERPSRNMDSITSILSDSIVDSLKTSCPKRDACHQRSKSRDLRALPIGALGRDLSANAFRQRLASPAQVLQTARTAERLKRPTHLDNGRQKHVHKLTKLS